MTLNKFALAYVEAALWSSTDDNGDPLDDALDMTDIDSGTLDAMRLDCERFERENEALLDAWYELGETPERAGHDFWLTRNGHGTGFWDRWSGGTPGDALGRKLTAATKLHGESGLYVGDDGKVYGQ